MPSLSKVLLVDDDDTVNFYNQYIFSQSGLTAAIEIKENGSEAITYIQNCIQLDQHVPELILLDINMPVMNGFEFLDRFEIFNYHQSLNVKIVLLTTSDHPYDHQQAGKYSSISRYMTKSLTKEKLIGLVDELFSQ